MLLCCKIQKQTVWVIIKMCVPRGYAISCASSRLFSFAFAHSVLAGQHSFDWVQDSSGAKSLILSSLSHLLPMATHAASVIQANSLLTLLWWFTTWSYHWTIIPWLIPYLTVLQVHSTGEQKQQEWTCILPNVYHWHCWWSHSYFSIEQKPVSCLQQKLPCQANLMQQSIRIYSLHVSHK